MKTIWESYMNHMESIHGGIQNCRWCILPGSLFTGTIFREKRLQVVKNYYFSLHFVKIHYPEFKPGTMVHKERRKKLALHLRHFSVGLISNDDFEDVVMDDVSDGWLPDQYYRSPLSKSDDEDPIIKPMLELCWGLYDDTRNHKLVKSDELTKDALKIIARCILFLHSDREYEWPYFNTNNPLLRFSLKDLILSILTLGYHYRNKIEEHTISYYEWQKLGDYDVWPFFKKSDFEEQLRKQPFLSGEK